LFEEAVNLSKSGLDGYAEMAYMSIRLISTVLKETV